MTDEERSCVLRTLNLCDGTTAITRGPRALPTPCYCERLSRTQPGSPERSRVLHDLARTVVAADELTRIVERRMRLGSF